MAYRQTIGQVDQRQAVQTVRYRQTFPWVVDVTISSECFKEAHDRTAYLFIPIELCLHIYEDILICGDIRQDARSFSRAAAPKPVSKLKVN